MRMRTRETGLRDQARRQRIPSHRSWVLGARVPGVSPGSSAAQLLEVGPPSQDQRRITPGAVTRAEPQARPRPTASDRAVGQQPCDTPAHTKRERRWAGLSGRKLEMTRCQRPEVGGRAECARPQAGLSVYTEHGRGLAVRAQPSLTRSSCSGFSFSSAFAS